MARPRKIDDFALLEIAREVFVKDGVSGSTKKIAKQVGCSEAALFKRYRTKNALLLAALLPAPANVRKSIELASTGRDRQRALVTIAEDVLDYFRTAVPLMLPLVTHPKIGRKLLHERLDQDPVHAWRNAIRWYFAGEARQRHVSNRDPEAVAELVVCALYSIALFEIFGFRKQRLSKAGVAQLISVLWEGCGPISRRPRQPDN